MWQLGFELLDKLESFGYHCTPMNSFDVAGRLDELDRRHTEHLRLPDFEEWKRRHGV